MTNRTVHPLILVGYSKAWHDAIAEHDPGLIFIEEPDAVRRQALASPPNRPRAAFELIAWEYQLPAAADRFYLAHHDLEPAAVIPVTEYAVPFAARLAERYGRPGSGFGAAELLCNKHLLRQATAEAGVLNPRWLPVKGPDDVRAFVRRCGRSVVLKPANRRGPVGARLIDRGADVASAWLECTQRDARAVVPDRRPPLQMLVEEYVGGDEYSVEMLVHEGEPLFTNVTSTSPFPGARPVEMTHSVPGQLSPQLRELLSAHTRCVIEAVGFATGYVHCEWIVSHGLPYLVECAGRMPVDDIVPLIDRAWGIETIPWLVTVMRGEPLQTTPPSEAPRGAAVHYLSAPPGEVVRVTGVEEATRLAGVIHAEVKVTPGHCTSELRGPRDRVGCVTAESDSSHAAMRLAAKAAGMISIEVVADGSVVSGQESTRARRHYEAEELRPHVGPR